MSDSEFKIEGRWRVESTDPDGSGKYLGVTVGWSQFEIIRDETGKLMLCPQLFIGWGPEEITLLDLDLTAGGSGTDPRYIGLMYALVADPDDEDKPKLRAAQVQLDQYGSSGDLKFEVQVIGGGGMGGNSGRGGRT